MIKKILELLNRIRISMKCCLQSECSLNENNILDDDIDETTENYEELKSK